MRRRTFVGATAIGGGAVGLTALEHMADPAGTRISFHVAGVRFQQITAQPEAMDAVVIRRDVRAGATAYVVLSAGTVLGYVPRAIAAGLEGRTIVGAYLSAANHHAVPWKRFEVTLTLG